MRVISLGWGVQSFTLAAMSALGELPKVDYAIHADTTHESQLTYAFARKWTPWLEEHGVIVVVVATHEKKNIIDKWGGMQLPAYTESAKYDHLVLPRTHDSAGRANLPRAGAGSVGTVQDAGEACRKRGRMTNTVTGTIPAVLNQVKYSGKFDLALIAQAECEYDELKRQVQNLLNKNDKLRFLLINERSKTQSIFENEREK